MPVPKPDQTVPSHRAIRSAVPPPADRKIPPATNSLFGKTARAWISPFKPAGVPAPSVSQTAPFHSAMLLAKTVPAIRNSPAATSTGGCPPAPSRSQHTVARILPSKPRRPEPGKNAASPPAAGTTHGIALTNPKMLFLYRDKEPRVLKTLPWFLMRTDPIFPERDCQQTRCEDIPEFGPRLRSGSDATHSEKRPAHENRYLICIEGKLRPVLGVYLPGTGDEVPVDLVKTELMHPITNAAPKGLNSIIQILRHAARDMPHSRPSAPGISRGNRSEKAHAGTGTLTQLFLSSSSARVSEDERSGPASGCSMWASPRGSSPSHRPPPVFPKSLRVETDSAIIPEPCGTGSVPGQLSP